MNWVGFDRLFLFEINLIIDLATYSRIQLEGEIMGIFHNFITFSHRIKKGLVIHLTDFFYFCSFVTRLKVSLLWAFLSLSLVSPLIEIYILLVTKDLINGLTTLHNSSVILRSLLILALVIVLSEVIGWLAEVVEEYAKVKLEERVNGMSMRSIMQQDVLSFESEDFQRKLSLMQNTLSNTIFNFVTSIGEFVSRTVKIVGLIYVIHSMMNIYISLIFLALLVPIAIISGRLKNHAVLMSWLNSYDNLKVGYYKYLLTSNTHSVEIALNRLKAPFMQRWSEFISKTMTRNRANSRKQMNFSLLMSALTMLGLGAYIISLTREIPLTSLPGDLYFAIMTGFELLTSAQALVLLFSVVLYSHKGFMQYSDIISIVVEKPEPSSTTPSQNKPHVVSVKLTNVSFAYGSNVVLKDISFAIQHGEKVAIVGHNGAGKSSLYYCLLGLIKPSAGHVSIGGDDPYILTPTEKEQRFSVVMQEIALYRGFSIRDNIMLGRPVELKESYRHIFERESMDELLGGHLGGTELSGGQAQRMAIMRALTGNGDIVILDEPTAALDPIAEAALIQELISYGQDKTLILTTHRMGITTQFDKIIVMKEGRVAEMGHPRDLLQRDGEYKKMFAAQGEIFQRMKEDAL
jgi:ATP-binding cassette subfamily B protein